MSNRKSASDDKDLMIGQQNSTSGSRIGQRSPNSTLRSSATKNRYFDARVRTGRRVLELENKLISMFSQ